MLAALGLRLIKLLATGPSWLVEAIRPSQDRLWSSFDLIDRDELSWYNR